MNMFAFESLLQQGMVGGSLLAYGFDPRLFVAIVIAGVLGIIGLFIFSISHKAASVRRYGFWRK
jgi:hypothetical protein